MYKVTNFSISVKRTFAWRLYVAFQVNAIPTCRFNRAQGSQIKFICVLTPYDEIMPKVDEAQHKNTLRLGN